MCVCNKYHGSEVYMCYINPPMRKFETISPEGQKPEGDIFSRLPNWEVNITNID